MISKTNIHSNIELKKGKKIKFIFTISDFFFFDTRIRYTVAFFGCESHM